MKFNWIDLGLIIVSSIIGVALAVITFSAIK